MPLPGSFFAGFFGGVAATFGSDTGTVTATVTATDALGLAADGARTDLSWLAPSSAGTSPAFPVSHGIGRACDSSW
jgi:hypothetical protein